MAMLDPEGDDARQRRDDPLVLCALANRFSGVGVASARRSTGLWRVV